MKVTYTPCHFPNAHGYITLVETGVSDGHGPIINLIGCDAMTQTELDGYGQKMADALTTDDTWKEIATSPMFGRVGHVRWAIVLRAYYNATGGVTEYVVHTKISDPDSSNPHFTGGNYFKPDQQQDAYRCWLRRCGEVTNQF